MPLAAGQYLPVDAFGLPILQDGGMHDDIMIGPEPDRQGIFNEFIKHTMVADQAGHQDSHF